VSCFGEEDAALHYSDGSHRWTPPGFDQDPEVWINRVREHVDRHRLNPDGDTFAPGAGRLSGSRAEPHRAT
jgi:hypothetical protein